MAYIVYRTALCANPVNDGENKDAPFTVPRSLGGGGVGEGGDGKKT